MKLPPYETDHWQDSFIKDTQPTVCLICRLIMRLIYPMKSHLLFITVLQICHLIYRLIFITVVFICRLIYRLIKCLKTGLKSRLIFYYWALDFTNLAPSSSYILIVGIAVGAKLLVQSFKKWNSGGFGYSARTQRGGPNFWPEMGQRRIRFLLKADQKHGKN